MSSEQGGYKPSESVPVESETKSRELVAIISVFEQAGFPLYGGLQNMLRDSTEHRYIPETAQNLRKGGGFLQATREIARYVRRGIAKGDTRFVIDRALLNHILSRALVEATETRPKLQAMQSRSVEWQEILRQARLDHLHFKEEELVEELRMIALRRENSELTYDQLRSTGQYSAIQKRLSEAMTRVYEAQYELDRLQDDLSDLVSERLNGQSIPVEWWEADPRKVEELRVSVDILPEGERLVANMLLDMLDTSPLPDSLPKLPISEKEKSTGTCTTAEVYFLDFVTRSAGYQNPDIVVDATGDPLMLLKNAGERSAFTLKDTELSGMRLPKGSLLEVEEDDGVAGRVRSLDSIKGVQLLRLTSLAVSPKERKEAVGSLHNFYQSQGVSGHDTVRIEELYERAKRMVS